MWAVERIQNALYFEEIDAVAEHVAVECITTAEQMEAATGCEEARARLTGEDQRLSEVFRVRTQYKSPADGQQHTASVLISKNQLKKLDLKKWRVLASKENAGEIRLARPFL